MTGFQYRGHLASKVFLRLIHLALAPGPRDRIPRCSGKTTTKSDVLGSPASPHGAVKRLLESLDSGVFPWTHCQRV